MKDKPTWLQKRLIVAMNEWLTYFLLILSYNFMPRWFFYCVIFGYFYAVLYHGYHKGLGWNPFKDISSWKTKK